MKPAKVLLFYYIFLGLSSILFSYVGIGEALNYNYAGKRMKFEPMIVPIIIGGLISLRLTVSARSFKIFIMIYAGLWALRFFLLYFANKIGGTYVFGHYFRIDLIVNNYYKTVSRLDTHLPFVLYWFVNYFFGNKPATDQATDSIDSQSQPVKPE